MKKLTKFKAFVLNNPKNFILIAVLYALLCVFFPLERIYFSYFTNPIPYSVTLLLFKFLCSVLPIIFYISLNDRPCGITDAFSIITLIICFIIAINNFPYFTVLEKFGYLSTNAALWFRHGFYCLATSIFEEVIFRGLILTLLLNSVFCNEKFKQFKSILVSSLLFSLMHVVNLFSGEAWYFVLLQISYSFLMGAVFALGYFISSKLWVAVALHFIYNFGGLLQDNGLISGGLWSPFQTVETTILSTVFGIVILCFVIKKLIVGVNNESGGSKG